MKHFESYSSFTRTHKNTDYKLVSGHKRLLKKYNLDSSVLSVKMIPIIGIYKFVKILISDTLSDDHMMSLILLILCYKLNVNSELSKKLELELENEIPDFKVLLKKFKLILYTLLVICNIVFKKDMVISNFKKLLNIKIILKVLDSIGNFCIGQNMGLQKFIYIIDEKDQKVLKNIVEFVNKEISTDIRGLLLKENVTNEQVEDVILYHGSNTKFDEFDDTKVSSGDSSDLFGKGFYLTDKEGVAKFYAKMVTKKDKVEKWTNTGIFGSPEPHFSPDADEHAEKNFKVNSFRIKGNILNSKTYILDDKFLSCLKELFIKENFLGKSGDKLFDDKVEFMRNNQSRIRNYRGELWYLMNQCGFRDKKPITDFITKIGCDGLKYETDSDYEGETGWNYVIYNKSIIKPA